MFHFYFINVIPKNSRSYSSPVFSLAYPFIPKITAWGCFRLFNCFFPVTGELDDNMEFYCLPGIPLSGKMESWKMGK